MSDKSIYDNAKALAKHPNASAADQCAGRMIADIMWNGSHDAGHQQQTQIVYKKAVKSDSTMSDGARNALINAAMMGRKDK